MHSRSKRLESARIGRHRVFKLHVLASGSKGNATIVEDAVSGAHILIDCGITRRDLLARCDEISVDPTRITDILVTHEHTDHTKGLGVVVRALEKRGASVSVRSSAAIRNASPEIADALESENARFVPFSAGEALSIGGVKVLPFPTSHDAMQSFGFRFETDATGIAAGPDALAYLTDTGYVTDEAKQAMEFARIVAIEANHDFDMLMSGSYPYVLKRRIASTKGHLSNDQAADAIDELLASLGGGALERVVAMHISQENNTYDLPARALGAVLERSGHAADVVVSRQTSVVSV